MTKTRFAVALALPLSLVVISPSSYGFEYLFGSKWDIGGVGSFHGYTAPNGPQTAGSATWSFMPSGLVMDPSAAALDPDHAPLSSTGLITDLAVTGYTLADYTTLMNSALTQWASVSKFSNLGPVADGFGAAGAPGAAGAAGNIRVGAWTITGGAPGHHVLAHNFAPGSATSAGGNNIFGDMHISLGPTWVDNPTDNAGDGSTNYDLYTVVLHELGHALGLGHTTVPGSVMQNAYLGGRRVLGPDDIAGIQALYGGSGAAYFSVAAGAEGVNVAPPGKSPNDVFALGASPKTGIVFFSDMDGTNTVSIPSAGLGLLPLDNVDALSNATSGTLGGSAVLVFSVDSAASGAPGTDLRYNAMLSAPAAPFGGLPPGNPGGGDPGNESASDIYASSHVPSFGYYSGVESPIVAHAGKNRLFADEATLGLQAPALNGSSSGAPEDELDGMELDGSPALFSLEAGSPTAMSPAVTVYDLGAVPVAYPFTAHIPGETRTPDDIFIGGGAAIYAPGHTMGLVRWEGLGIGEVGDDIDALVVSDVTFSNSPPPPHVEIAPNGFLNPGIDRALFSLAPGSPSLIAGGFSPGDVFFTSFGGGFTLYASAESLGLLPGDNIDALDIRIGELPPDLGQFFLSGIPEPSTFILATLGLTGLGLVDWRRRRRA